MSDPSAVNSQITDAVSQLNSSVPALAPAFGAATAFQVVTNAIALRFQNLVAQQQHDHILRNAITTAAAQAVLDGKREEAEAIMKLAESRLPAPDLVAEVAQLKAALRDLHEELAKFVPPVSSTGTGPASAPPPSQSAGKAKTKPTK